MIGDHVSRRSRRKRAAFLFGRIDLQPEWRILDLGGGTGRHIRAIMPSHRNVVVCDHSAEDLEAARRLGYETVLVDGSDTLPFRDGEFDLVFCSSVIEHVTGPKDAVEGILSTRAFAANAWTHQTRFAREIARIAKRYYVQTPHRYFPVESHSLLPMPIVLLSRANQMRVIAASNRFWLKEAFPDWHLLVPSQMQDLFPGATIHIEKAFGFPKSIMAIRR